MNPLTLVKRIQNINSKEAQLGISEDASWHAKYKDSAYVYAGGLPFDLTEGDLLAIFAQYGEVVDVNLVRDKATGKSKGFAFVAYEDQRSTVLAVDNLNGAQVVGRTIRVDHVTKYKKKAEEDEEEEQRKREERGVCRAFQRGDCTRGATCKFSHNEQRAANTGWGEQDPKWGRDKYDGPKKGGDRSGGIPSNRVAEAKGRGNSDAREERRWGRRQDGDEKLVVGYRICELLPPRRGDEDNDELRPSSREDYGRREEQRSRRHNDDDDDDRREDKRPRRRGDDNELEPKAKSRDREDRDRREDTKPRRRSDDRDRKGDDSREDNRPRRQSDGGEFVPKSRDDSDRKEDDSRENKRLRKRSDDDEFDPKSVDDHDRREEKRSRRQNDDEFEQKSRAGQDKREGERLRRHDDDEVQPRSREFRNRSEKRY